MNLQLIWVVDMTISTAMILILNLFASVNFSIAS